MPTSPFMLALDEKILTADMHAQGNKNVQYTPHLPVALLI